MRWLHALSFLDGSSLLFVMLGLISACSDVLRGGTGSESEHARTGDAGARADADAPSADSPSGGSDAGVGQLADDADAAQPSALRCNGHAELCDRPYDQIAFAATHNAQAAAEYGYSAINRNQTSGIETQLADGIRCLLLDVYEDAGEHVLCHGRCELAKTSHLDALVILRSFLEQNPHEVLTIIYEDHLSARGIADDFATAGLEPYLYTHREGAPFPTLRQMIDAGARLVVTAENAKPPPTWLHHVWDLAWDTPYSFHSLEEMSCTPNRGDAAHPLFLLNHWVSSGIGNIYLPSEDRSKAANAYDVLLGRAERCRNESGRIPNFVAVDFYEHGDLLRVVDALNGL
jgi:hypothetical protein